MPVSYPFDFTGNSPANLVTNELHAVSESTYGTYNFIVPNFAPFFVDNFSATITENNVTRPLVEDVDFSFALEYVTGTRTVGKVLYGAITLHNLSATGIITLNYQTLGGDIADRLLVLTRLANMAYNPRTTFFDVLIDTPAAFPPVPHYEDYDNFYGQEEVVKKLGEIRDAIAANSSLTRQEIINFMDEMSNGTITAYVKRAGDTMTGPLFLHADPTQPLQAATKQYVDAVSAAVSGIGGSLANYATISYVDSQDATKVSKSGDTMTGHLTLSGDPSQPLHAATKQYVDNVNTNIQGQITNLQNQINTLNVDPVTKQYVDNRINEILVTLNNILLNI